MQVVLGEWHDWTVLASKAERALGKRGRKGGLVKLLETLAAQSLKRALGVCRRLTARLLKHAALPQQAALQQVAEEAAVHKMPVRRAEPVSIVRESRRAC